MIELSFIYSFIIMKQINRDYISVIRKSEGRLKFERIPVIKSDRLLNTLMGMSCDDKFTLEDMEDVLTSDPLYSQLMLPYFDMNDDRRADDIDPFNLHVLEAIQGYQSIKTKPEFYLMAQRVIELLDYKWTLMKNTIEAEDIILHSVTEGESINISIKLTADTSIILYGRKIGQGGRLSITVKHKDVYVAPYLSLVNLYDCDEKILSSTIMLDPDIAQLDYAFLTVVRISNEIIQNEQSYFERNVVDAGKEMLSALMCLKDDIFDYFCWQEKQIEGTILHYSGNELAWPDNYQSKEAEELSDHLLKAKKMWGGLILGDNLSEWAELGGIFSVLENVESHIILLAKETLKHLDEVVNNLKELDGLCAEEMVEDLKRIVANLHRLLDDSYLDE